MKRNLIALLICLFSISAFGQHIKKDLVGKWQGTDSQNVTASIEFLDTAKVSVSINGGHLPPYDFKVDFTKKPATLDIVMVKPDGTSATLPGYLIFVDDNTIRWQIFPGGNRPAVFDENSEGGSIITLKRVK